MVDCAIIGDEITANVIYERSQCYTKVLESISSTNYALWAAMNISADHVLISLGTYDKSTVNTERNLIEIRKKLNSKKVTWLLSSANQSANQIAKSVAERFGDQTIEIRPYVGSDGVHLTQEGAKHIADMWLTR